MARSYGVKAASTVGVLAALLGRGTVTPAAADIYLDVLRAHGRMRVPMTSIDLLAGALGSWA